MFQEIPDLGRAVSHLGGQGELRVIAEAQQLGQFAAQGQGFVDNVAVVPLPPVRSFSRGAGTVGPIHFLSQYGIVTVSQHRVERRELQVNEVAFQARLLCGLAGAGQGGFRQAGQLLPGDLF